MHLNLNLLTTTLVMVSLMLAEPMANPFTHRTTQMVSLVTRTPVKALSSKFLPPTSPLVFKRLALREPEAFRSLCNCMFSSVPLLDEDARAVHHRPYFHDSKNAFFGVCEPMPEEDDMVLLSSRLFPYGYSKDGTLKLAPNCLFERKDPKAKRTTPPPIAFATEIQFTKRDLWSDISMFNTVPRSDSQYTTSVYNLITDPKNKLDRTVVFGSPNKADISSKVLRVTQVGLGAERLKKSDNPETKAWLQFLTTTPENLTPPSNIPAIVASAYPALAKPKHTVYPYISTDKLEIAQIMIEYFKSERYPLATIVKQTGLSPLEIKRVLNSKRK